MLCSPKPCFPLTECIRVAFSILGFSCIRDDGLGGRNMSLTVGKELDVPVVGKKRSAKDSCYLQLKRQRTSEIGVISLANELTGAETTDFPSGEQDDAGIFHSKLTSFVGLLNPDNAEASLLRPEIAIMAVSLLCIALCGFPNTSLSITICQQVFSWIPWICNQVSGKL